MKKILSIFVAAAIMSLTLAACNDNKDNDKDNVVGDIISDSISQLTSTTPTETEPEDITSDNEVDPGEEVENTDDTDPGDDPSTDELSVSQLIAYTIREAYDPDTLPFIDLLPEELINDRYGLTDDMYDEIACLVPMISTFVDTVVVVKAADGKVSDVEEALKSYHTVLVADSIQYPMNIEKVNAGQVVVNGDYVAFIMLGAMDDREDATDSERAEFATDQVQIGVDVFNSYFG